MSLRKLLNLLNRPKVAKTCDKCSYICFAPSTSEDIFHDGVQCALCTKAEALIKDCIEHPREMINIKRPLWCPNLGRKLSKDEKKIVDIILPHRKEEYKTHKI